MTKPRPTLPCGWCGEKTVNANAVCRNCVTIDAHAHDVPPDAVALTDGVWRLDPFRRVQAWVPEVAA